MRSEEIIILIAPYVPAPHCLDLFLISKYVYEKLIREFRCIFENTMFKLNEFHRDFGFLKALSGKITKLNLNMNKNISGKELMYLKNVKILNMNSCDQKLFKKDDFKNLKGISELYMSYTTSLTRKNECFCADEIFEYLEGVKILHTADNYFKRSENFKYLKGIEELDISWSEGDGICDNLFKYLKGIKRINLRLLTDRISLAALKYLSNAEEIKIGGEMFDEHDDALEYLKCIKNVQKLTMRSAEKVLKNYKNFKYFKNLKYLDVSETYKSVIGPLKKCDIFPLDTFKVSECSDISLLEESDVKIKIVYRHFFLSYDEPGVLPDIKHLEKTFGSKLRIGQYGA